MGEGEARGPGWCLSVMSVRHSNQLLWERKGETRRGNGGTVARFRMGGEEVSNSMAREVGCGVGF
jgi:hypothetical protein